MAIRHLSSCGTLEQATDTAFAPYTVGYEERNTGGEFGVVPADMVKAIVCMKVGTSADCSGRAFGSGRSRV